MSISIKARDLSPGQLYVKDPLQPELDREIATIKKAGRMLVVTFTDDTVEEFGTAKGVRVRYPKVDAPTDPSQCGTVGADGRKCTWIPEHVGPCLHTYPNNCAAESESSTPGAPYVCSLQKNHLGDHAQQSPAGGAVKWPQSVGPLIESLMPKASTVGTPPTETIAQIVAQAGQLSGTPVAPPPPPPPPPPPALPAPPVIEYCKVPQPGSNGDIRCGKVAGHGSSHTANGPGGRPVDWPSLDTSGSDYPETTPADFMSAEELAARHAEVAFMTDSAPTPEVGPVAEDLFVTATIPRGAQLVLMDGRKTLSRLAAPADVDPSQVLLQLRLATEKVDNSAGIALVPGHSWEQHKTTDTEVVYRRPVARVPS